VLIIKKNLVILSRGVGGISTAYNLKKINRGWPNPKNITLELNSLFPKVDVNFINKNYK
jgi:hypothetical protein